MVDVANVVTVNLTIQDATPAVANFGAMAIFAGDGPLGAGTWQGTYDASPSGLAAMVTDGFSQTGGAYLKAAAIVAQSPRTAQFKVYKRAAVNVHSLTLTITKTTPGFKQKLEIGVGSTLTALSYTNGGSETTTTIATAFELLIEAVAGIDSTSSAAAITVTPNVAGTRISIRNVVKEITVDDPSPDAGIATDLAAAVGEDPDFFGFVIDGTGGTEIAAAGAWALSNSRMFIALSADSDILGSGSSDVASVLKAASNIFAGVLFSRDTSAGADASLMARQFSRDPGSSSYHMKELPGVTADNLTATEFANARSKNAITYVNTKGLNRTYDGKAASGRFLDITHGAEWLKARIAERCFAVAANLEKIDYTDAGIALYEAEIRAQLSEAESKGLLASGWTVTVPKASTVSASNKSLRKLQDIKFNGVLTGAIHSAVIDGTIKV
jgi:hypothetical protein